jgi:integrase
MNIQMKYLSREKSGLYMFYRQIPADLRHHYQGKIFRRQSLHTHDHVIAAKEALRLARLDDQIWAALRNGAPDIEAASAGTQMLDPAVLRGLIARVSPKRHYLADALDIYLRKHRGRDERFVQNAKRSVKTAQDILGNPNLKDIRRADARRVLDAMLGQGLKTASVKRYFGTICAIFSTAILELELNFANPFSSHTIPNAGRDAKVIPSFSETELRQIATAGLGSVVEAGLIATMQINLGCRVHEIAALRIEDIHLNCEIPHISIREHHAHGRTLKTGRFSERTLPLLGCSLEATRVALAGAKDGGWLFARIDKRNPASTVNKWLRKVLGGKPGSHQTRHSFETKLILAKTDQRLIDCTMGHKLKGQGATYFSGYGLEDLAEALARIAL